MYSNIGMKQGLTDIKEMQPGKVVFWSLAVLDALFLIYYLILAHFSRLHYDDMNLMWNMREMGFWGVETTSYFTQTGRFAFTGVNGIMAAVSCFLGYHQFWPILFYVLGIGICFYVVKDFPWRVSKRMLFATVCFVYNLYVLTAIDFPVFYWLVAIQYYLFFPIMLLILKLLNSDELNWKQWVVLAVSVFYLGGVNEAFTPVVLVVLFGNGLFLLRTSGWNVKASWANPKVRRIVWFGFVLLLLWAIVVAAPGNYVRLSGNEHESFVRPQGIVGYAVGLADAIACFFYFMAFYAPYYFVVFALAFCLGAKSEKSLRISKCRLSLLLCFGFLLYLLISSLPIVYIYGGFGIQRVYTHAVLALLFTVFALGYICGMHRKPVVMRWVTVAGVFVLAVIMCVNISQDTPSAKAYAKTVDDRLEYLSFLKEQGQKGTITVQPLSVPYTKDCKYCLLSLLGKKPQMSVLYYISDVGLEPNEYEYHLKRFMGLGFDFVANGESEAANHCATADPVLAL